MIMTNMGLEYSKVDNFNPKEPMSDETAINAMVKYFEDTVREDDFHYASRGEKKIVGYSANHHRFTQNNFDKAVAILTDKGYDCYFYSAYCGHGPFPSIVYRGMIV